MGWIFFFSFRFYIDITNISQPTVTSIPFSPQRGLRGRGSFSHLGYLTANLLFQCLQVIDFCFSIYLSPPNWPRC